MSGLNVESIHPEPLGQFYEEMAAKLPDARLVFMNNGYADPEDDFSWLNEEDLDNRYSANFIRYLTQGLDLDGKEALDVGCGRGGTCSFLRRYTNLRTIHGLDYCQGAIDFCRRHHADDSLAFVQGDAIDLPFEDRRFDYVINCESSHCYSDINRFIREVYRVLRPGGVFTYSDGIAVAELSSREQALAEAGFGIVKSEDITMEVIRSLHRNRDHHRAFLESMTSSELDNHSMVEQVVSLLNEKTFDLLISGTAAVYAWRLQKA